MPHHPVNQMRVLWCTHIRHAVGTYTEVMAFSQSDKRYLLFRPLTWFPKEFPSQVTSQVPHGFVYVTSF